MEIVKSTNGFPGHWKAGILEKEIINIVEEKVRQQLNFKKVYIINLTWLHDEDLPKMIDEVNPDFIIAYNFVDPVVDKLVEAIKQSNIPYVMLGNLDGLRIDFWALVCDRHFRKYKVDELEISLSAKKFICLNRKPHWHRVRLVNNLIDAGLSDHGHISLGLPGDQAILLDTQFTRDQGITDEYSNMGTGEETVSSKIKNDIYSLGDLTIWNDSLLCLVTETEFEFANPNNFFISEKTWKPIIGLRPFFVYGQHKLRNYLEEHGFDVFNDVFDYSEVDTNSNDQALQVSQYSQVAINTINQLQNTKAQWSNMLFRLSKNKLMFHRYVDHQWKTIHSLNFKKYV